MNGGLWIAFGGLLITALTLAWTMRRAQRDDRARQLEAALERERQRTEYHQRVERNTQQLGDHERRLRRLEGRPGED